MLLVTACAGAPAPRPATHHPGVPASVAAWLAGSVLLHEHPTADPAPWDAGVPVRSADGGGWELLCARGSDGRCRMAGDGRLRPPAPPDRLGPCAPRVLRHVRGPLRRAPGTVVARVRITPADRGCAVQLTGAPGLRRRLDALLDLAAAVTASGRALASDQPIEARRLALDALDACPPLPVAPAAPLQTRLLLHAALAARALGEGTASFALLQRAAEAAPDWPVIQAARVRWARREGRFVEGHRLHRAWAGLPLAPGAGPLHHPPTGLDELLAEARRRTTGDVPVDPVLLAAGRVADAPGELTAIRLQRARREGNVREVFERAAACFQRDPGDPRRLELILALADLHHHEMALRMASRHLDDFEPDRREPLLARMRDWSTRLGPERSLRILLAEGRIDLATAPLSRWLATGSAHSSALALWARRVRGQGSTGSTRHDTPAAPGWNQAPGVRPPR